MSFDNLEERFLAKMADLYEGSARLKSDGGTSRDPIIEKKPGVNNTNYGEDTRSVPIKSTVTDLERMTKWSTSAEGLKWYVNQEVLQTGNVFSDTRVYNPLFVIGNTQPFYHIKRPLSDSSGVAPSGDGSQKSSPESIGSSGRLQIETTNRINSLVLTGRSGDRWSSIAKWFPPVNVLNIASAISNVIRIGTLGINERPELNVYSGSPADIYYSVMLRNGFQKADGGMDTIKIVGANLRRGNFKGALNALTSPASTQVPAYQYPMKFFIKGKNEVDRYMDESVILNEYSQPIVNLPLTKTPFILRNPKTSGLPAIRTHDDIARSAEAQLSAQSGYLQPPIIIQEAVPGGESYGKDQMLYPESSLEEQYKTDPDGRLDFIRTTLPSQKLYWNLFKKFEDTTIPRVGGFGGGVRSVSPDGEVMLDSSPIANPRLQGIEEKNGKKRYFYDDMNSAKFNPSQTPMGIDLKSSHNIPGELISKYRDPAEGGVPTLVDLIIFDYVNKYSIPLRAYIDGLSQAVAPEFKDVFYIGRTERNIIYIGSKRSVSFNLKIHAFNEEELVNVWRKINYLTGLCYPSTYRNGFMVPPLVKLTLGDMYNNQPAYIRSMNTSVEDDMTWEVIPGLQVPHGITIQFQFELIEKQQPRTSDYDPVAEKGFNYYNFATSRSPSEKNKP